MSVLKSAKQAPLASATPLTTEASPASAVAPKRARGKLRVAAILSAGAAVFAEKSYDGATMTEIAARADTAIGSLYRFFPTKGALADVLLANYKMQLNDGLDALIATVRGSRASATPETLARALVDLMLSLRTNKDGVMAALEGRGDSLALRSDIREGMRQRLAELLAGAASLQPTRARVCAGMLQHLLKTVTPLANEDEAGLGLQTTETEAAYTMALTSTLPPLHHPLIDEVLALTTLYLHRIFEERPA